jgi:hypothetical protein
MCKSYQRQFPQYYRWGILVSKVSLVCPCGNRVQGEHYWACECGLKKNKYIQWSTDKDYNRKMCELSGLAQYVSHIKDVFI